MTGNRKIILEAYRDLKNKIAGSSSQSLRDSLKRYNNSVIFSYKYCPDLNEKPSAMLAAKAVVAAENQDKSEEIYQSLAGNPQEFTEEMVFNVVESKGLNMEQFKVDFRSPQTNERILRDIEDAKSCGLHVFPGLTINGFPYNGTWDDYSLFDAIEKSGGKKINKAIESFFDWGASAAAVLIIATIAALIMVNSGFQEVYEHWRHLNFGSTLGNESFILPLEIWINDFFMAIFFLMIGLEIKKEVLNGELSDVKRAAMPIIGAIGGMIIPALLFGLVNVGASTSNGWGIPMATDIAFTLGLMALLGNRVPIALKIFISALAVADDLGAIVVIALFYGHGFHILPFIGAILVTGLMFLLNRRKVFNISVYIFLGIILWYFTFESGLHATLAGVITAILIPIRENADLALIAEQINITFNREIKKIQDVNNPQKTIGYQSIEILKQAVERLREPSDYLMHSLEKMVNFLILPLFAFFNTGILLSGSEISFSDPGNLGILLGLVVGKPLGIVGACWIAAKTKIAQLSQEINWIQLIGASALAGVGFTMSIVVAASAFSGDSLTSAKISILVASTISALIGLSVLRFMNQK
ncbi:Na+/H+ antiporter NhaA [Flexithrix dorotheae]|uniref:Na+/H+ antiporter NhaA n=1 Tax=Flexithrix dorotheae TaxID=70993 RepID=UPI000370C067|nr:Na+/H+ antiporter NhaA [Flexithrix dorotheae]